MQPPIYVDHHSTTPCDPRVVAAMLPFFTGDYGNPAALTHAHGRTAAAAVEEARLSIAGFLGCPREEIVFTSGATEANNLALAGAPLKPGDHVVVSAIEHKSVLVPAERLAARGIEVTLLGVDHEGFVDPTELGAMLRPTTRLVSIAVANGEIGTIQPLRPIADVCRSRGILVHCDATQAIGKVPFDAEACDLVALSGHKIYGPKGVGILKVRRGVKLEPLISGGGQERNLRSGTLNVPGIVGLSRAIEICRAEMDDEGQRLTLLRNRFWDGVLAEVPRTFVNGPRGLRLPGNVSVTFESVDAEALILSLRRFSLSAGSACSSGDRQPSHVLRAIGLSEAAARGTIRIGFGRGNRDEDVTALIEDLRTAVANLREISAQ
ncbi:MAG: cysteine desulfurase family protein [Thermoanaerobaculia bacterium]